MSGFVFGSMFFVIGALTIRVKSRSFILQCLFRSIVVCSTLVAGMLIVIPTSIAILNGGLPWSSRNMAIFLRAVAPNDMAAWIGVGFALSLAINAVHLVSRKLGPGVFRNWLTGKYRFPVEEERIFMFLDLKNSTTLAEKLGNFKFSKLCQEFFRDLNYPVSHTKGEVSHYIGDEAVLTWKPKSGLEKANCIQAFFLMEEEIQSRSGFYLSEFGIVPEFKAGVHVGLVVAAEVGEIKSEIVYHGDVLNTTARITGKCTELDSDLLISGELSRRLNLPPELTSTDHGMHLLKGKEHGVEIIAIGRSGHSLQIPASKQPPLAPTASA